MHIVTLLPRFGLGEHPTYHNHFTCMCLTTHIVNNTSNPMRHFWFSGGCVACTTPHHYHLHAAYNLNFFHTLVTSWNFLVLLAWPLFYSSSPFSMALHSIHTVETHTHLLTCHQLSNHTFPYHHLPPSTSLQTSVHRSSLVRFFAPKMSNCGLQLV